MLSGLFSLKKYVKEIKFSLAPTLLRSYSVYVDHDGYNAQPYHNELIDHVIVLQKCSICSNNMHDELGK